MELAISFNGLLAGGLSEAKRRWEISGCLTPKKAMGWLQRSNSNQKFLDRLVKQLNFSSSIDVLGLTD